MPGGRDGSAGRLFQVFLFILVFFISCGFKNRGDCIPGEAGNIPAVGVNRHDHRAKGGIDHLSQHLRPMLALLHQGFGQRRKTGDVEKERDGLESARC